MAGDYAFGGGAFTGEFLHQCQSGSSGSFLHTYNQSLQAALWTFYEAHVIGHGAVLLRAAVVTIPGRKTHAVDHAESVSNCGRRGCCITVGGNTANVSFQLINNCILQVSFTWPGFLYAPVII